MIEISGFSDEISYSLDVQIGTLTELNQHFMCPRTIDKKNIADYTADEFAEKIKPRLDAAGIKFSSIGSPIGKIDLYDDEGYKTQLLKLKEMVKICEMTGCRYIRTFSFFVPKKGDYDIEFPEVVKRVKGFLKVVKGHDVILLHENEKKIYGDVPERVLKLYKAVGNPQYKLCYDASNYLQCGVNPYEAYEATKEYTVYYHMKDCLKKIEVPLGTGEGQIQLIIDDLVKRGYDGFLTLEPHTVKYALLKKYIYLLPPFGRLKTMREVYRTIDKNNGKKAFDAVGRKEVYVWQYNNLREILKKAGYIDG